MCFIIFYIGFRSYFGSFGFSGIPSLENIAVSANRRKCTVSFTKFFDEGSLGNFSTVAIEFYSDSVAFPSCIEGVVFCSGNKTFCSDL